MSARLAADVGGTFTDLVVADGDGHLHAAKVPSTPGCFEVGVLGGLDALLAAAGVDAPSLRQVLHGTTAGTNAVLERAGPCTALVTTAGFRDVLEIGRLRTPTLYDLSYEKPAPLVPRRLRIEVDERMAPDGTPLRAPDLEGLAPALDAVVRAGARALAVCLVNAYANPEHERAVAAFAARRHPGLVVTASTEVSREIGEFERTSTAVVNAYLRPVLSAYLDRLAAGLAGRGIGAPLFVMQSSGGMMPSAEAARLPAHLLESGPAAGVLAAAAVARRLGIDEAISFDMGGTTAKASLVLRGEVAHAGELAVGTEISAASRLLRGGGYAVRLPVVDLAEIGAGGGSIARVDAGGGLRVGPVSAGADPGPACYGRGGTAATVTDANLLLGYVSPEYLAASGVAASRALAAAAIERDVAKPLGLSVDEAALAIHRVADQQMARVLRAVSTERGHAIDRFSLVVSGGSGALHAASLAETVRIGRVVVPPLAGVLSALGMLEAPVELSSTETVLLPLQRLDAAALGERVAALAGDQRRRLAAAGVDPAVLEVAVRADLRYLGQAFELSLDLPGARLDAAALDALADAFHRRHRDTYGHGRLGELELVRVRVATLAPCPAVVGAAASAKPPSESRRALFAGERVEVPVVGRAELSRPAPGPLLVDEPDTTIVVPPGWVAALDPSGSVVLERAA
ncbi:MAG TPA: hydantoinase/oxoprolinase family protein [Acidimicrobiales bacterium]|nr:hydantoinase/oxoprolinase family protein [Acidimicrobiales bacterium]